MCIRDSLENVVNEAALLAARANKRAITMKEIEDATIKVIAGPEKRSKVVTEKEMCIRDRRWTAAGSRRSRTGAASRMPSRISWDSLSGAAPSAAR